MNVQPVASSTGEVHIFDADETGLFWKCLPDKNLSLKGEKCSGGKKNEGRIKVLVCANMLRSCLCLLLEDLQNQGVSRMLEASHFK